MKKINKIAFVVNGTKGDALSLAQDLAAFCEQRGVAGEVTTDYPLNSEFLRGADICCTVGGDGTILGVVGPALKYNVPILGINRGKLGFLATFSPDEVFENFEKILNGHFKLEERSLLSCKNSKGQTAVALNDIVIYKGSHNRLINLQVIADKELVSTYRCDGLIFTTPTGSTAYNLSANGPIIPPSARAIGMTPICPHTLSNRSVVFDEHSRIHVQCLDATCDLLFMIDGQTQLESPSCSLEIFVPPQKITLILPTDYSHFRILRNKLNWGD